MLRGVIFDMDGVIINSEPIYREIEAMMFRELGIKLSEDEHNLYVGTKTADMWLGIKEKYNLKQPVDVLVKLEAKNFRDYVESAGKIEHMPGVKELIADLFSEGVKLALASSSLRDDIDTVVKYLELGQFFSVIVSGEDVNMGKPAPDIFKRAVDLLGLLPKECVAIEDSKNGILAAKAAGIKCVGFKNNLFQGQDLSMADMVVTDFRELDTEMLKQLCEEPPKFR